MLFSVVLVVAALLGASADTSTTSDLLWPKPSASNFGTNVYQLNAASFSLTAKGQGSSSEILRDAFQRYSKLIFQTPAPFYPSGASDTFNGEISGLVFTVQSSDETLGSSTDESCKSKHVKLQPLSYGGRALYM